MPDRLEVAEADGVDLDQHAILGRGVGTFRQDAAQQSAGERRVLRDRGVLHARQRARTRSTTLIVEQLRRAPACSRRDRG